LLVLRIHTAQPPRRRPVSTRLPKLTWITTFADRVARARRVRSNLPPSPFDGGRTGLPGSCAQVSLWCRWSCMVPLPPGTSPSPLDGGYLVGGARPGSHPYALRAVARLECTRLRNAPLRRVGSGGFTCLVDSSDPLARSEKHCCSPSTGGAARQ
jgi:hypothetical protein